MNEEQIAFLVGCIFNRDSELGFCSHDISNEAMTNIVKAVLATKKSVDDANAIAKLVAKPASG